MSEIQIVSEHTPVSTACYAWAQRPKPKTGMRKTQVRKNQKSTWAKEGLGCQDVHSGDLLAMMYEQTDKDLARQRFPDQEDYKQKERRMGKRMLHTELVKRVLRLNGKLLYEDSRGVKDSGAFYLVANENGKQKKVYTGACFRKGWLPEWTTMKTDAADLPTQDGLTYGWRTVLQRLVQKQVITYRQVAETFGEVYRNDLCGKNWANFTAAFRT
jgi:hypothetical protein